MRTILYIFFKILGIIGLLVVCFNFFASTGYFLYLWGGTGLDVGISAWTAFKFCLWVYLFGIISLTGFPLANIFK